MTMVPMVTQIMTTDSSKGSVLRHESKHQIGLSEDLVLTRRLRTLFPHDRNAGPNGTYRVTSLYFDTPYDRALREKLDGVNRREKFRLRYYGADRSFIKLEKKYKINGLCGKRNARMTQQQVRNLLAGDITFLLDGSEPLFVELYSKMQGQGLRPKTIVCYDREAFFYSPGNVRITLDRNVRTGLHSLDFLNTDLHHLSALEHYTILEVKYDAFLPELVRAAIQVPGRQASSCSKYAICRRFD